MSESLLLRTSEAAEILGLSHDKFLEACRTTQPSLAIIQLGRPLYVKRLDFENWFSALGTAKVGSTRGERMEQRRSAGVIPSRKPDL